MGEDSTPRNHSRRNWGSDDYIPLFEPDTLLPAQYFAGLVKGDGVDSERSLMLAVLRDAVECHMKYAHSRNPKTRELFEESHEWIYSRESDWPFSFENICETLGVSPEYIRDGLGRPSRTSKKGNGKAPVIHSVRERARSLDDFD